MRYLLLLLLALSLSCLCGCEEEIAGKCGGKADCGLPDLSNDHRDGSYNRDGVVSDAVWEEGVFDAAEAAAGIEVPPPDEMSPDVQQCPEGMICNPIVISELPFHDERDGNDAPSDEFDYYSPCAPEVNETGPEFIYVLHVEEAGILYAKLDEVEDDGVDMDVHLLYDLDPNACLARGHVMVGQYVEPGTYYIVIDTWVDSSGTAFPGPYKLDVYMSGGSLLPDQAGFNKYVVDAINDLSQYPKDGTYPFCYSNPSCEPDVPIYFGMVHDGYYMGEYLFEGTGMCYCCGHTLEIFLDAYRRWQADNGVPEDVGYGGLSLDDMDLGPFYQYWFGWGVTSDASSGDAFEYAGIGMNIYEENWDKALTGDFAQISRSNGTGHAVIFVHWIEEGGEKIGLRYYGCNSSGDSLPDPDDPDNQPGNSGPSFVTEYFSGHGGKVLPKYLHLGRAFDPWDL